MEKTAYRGALWFTHQYDSGDRRKRMRWACHVTRMG